jgi:predicted metalloprotease
MPRTRIRRLCTALSLFALLLLVLGGSAAQARTAAPAPFTPFLDDVLLSVDTYWHETDAAEGRPAPSVNHVWVEPNAKVATACGAQAADDAAFYCPTDDTIYIGQTFASALYDGVAKGLPGQQAGYGAAVGDFAVAYVVAHEYGHNVQQELGLLGSRTRALPTELNADCLAGTWAGWANAQGRLDAGDLDEALNAALAVGDFDYLSPQHHGTPQERRDALETGIKATSPAACDTYLKR